MSVLIILAQAILAVFLMIVLVIAVAALVLVIKSVTGKLDTSIDVKISDKDENE